MQRHLPCTGEFVGCVASSRARLANSQFGIFNAFHPVTGAFIVDRTRSDRSAEENGPESEVVQLKRRLRQAEAGMVSLELASSFIHEMRAALSELTGHLTQLFDQCKWHGIGDKLIVDATARFEHLRVLVDGYSRIPDGLFESETRVVSLGKAVETTLSKFQHRLRKMQIVLTTELGESAQSAMVPGKYTELILANLLSNAVKAVNSSERSRKLVTLRAVENAGYLHVSVMDNGPGVPPQMMDKVWEPFSTTYASATGLGLSMVRHAVQEAGGDVHLTSDSTGCCVTFTIPIDGGE